MKFKARINMALKAFMGTPFELIIEPYSIEDKLKPGVRCDTRECKNDAAVCLSQTTASFRIIREDHCHVCSACAELINWLVGKRRRVEKGGNKIG